MVVLPTILVVLASLIFLMWTSRHVVIWHERRTGFLLSEDYPGPLGDAPRISVLVAAKDEQENIGACVRSICRQDYPNFKLIVCNDRSTDATGDIVRRIAAEDDRVRLIDIDSLPDGWCGKNNAMQTGIADDDGEWLCMIDADCKQDSHRTLSAAMQYALDCKVDLLSVLPNLTMRGFWENVIQPVCGGVMMIWFNPDHVNDPENRTAYANGAFMLMKRDAYRAIGTHEAVKDQVNEDMHMAARIKAAGLKLRVVRNRGLYQVRMYRSLGQIIRGWSRIFYGTFGTLRRLSVSLALLFTMGLLPYICMAVGFSLAGGALWRACGLIGAAAAVMQISVIYRFYKLIGARKLLAWTYPIGCVVTVVSLVMSLTKLRRGARIVWRDTTYSGSVKS
ncbi:MAG: glycosyltransferase family 2 protein [Planctomycetota bacterium]|nr:glycosyltransferase family 2 protein [Planctomycetota bacterium]